VAVVAEVISDGKVAEWISEGKVAVTGVVSFPSFGLLALLMAGMVMVMMMVIPEGSGGGR
jgi:hypothetical protein